MALHGGTAMLSAPPMAVLLQALLQGGLSGLAAPVLFAAAIGRLGPARASAFGGLTPAAAALFGLLLLGESPDGTTLCALCLAGLGVGITGLSPALPRARPASA
jgi:drug/metabolite transporter (DMT)-like permease